MIPSISADVSRLKVRLCNVDVVSSNSPNEPRTIDNQIDVCQTRRPSVYSTLQPPAQPADVKCLPKVSDSWTEWENPIKSLATRPTLPLGSSPTQRAISNCNEGSPKDSHIRIEASVLPLHRCDRYCLCQCHKVTNLATPSSYSNAIGRLFVGYVGLPLLSHQNCNRISCRQGRTQARIRIAYLFPVWFALRLIAFTLTKASTTFMWTLSFPIVTQSATPVVIYVSLGNMTKVQSLLASREGTINTIDATASKSPLHVSAPTLRGRQAHHGSTGGPTISPA